MPASQASLRLTDAYRAQLLGLRRRATVAVAGLWAIDFDELDRSFAVWVGRSARLVGAAQFDMARLSAAYVAAYLASETRAPVPPVPVDPARFAGVNAFGRPLAVVLAPALLTVKAGLAEGRPPEVASAAGQARAVRTTVTTTQASADGALDTALEAHPRVRGWRRVVSGGGCGACLGLANGQVEEPGTPMLRHANCLPGDVLVSGPAVSARTRRWHEGELVVIQTAGGKELPVTPNHPILTSRGWVPATLVQKGDYVIGSRNGDGPLRDVPYEQQVPTRIEDGWGTGLVALLRRVPLAAEDFHGDGAAHSKVDVVPADGFLWDDGCTCANEPSGESLLGRRVMVAGAFPGDGHLPTLRVALGSSPDGIMGGACTSSALLRGQAGGLTSSGLAASTDLHPGRYKAPAHRSARQVVSTGHGKLRHAGYVVGDHRLRVDVGAVQPVGLTPIAAAIRYDPTIAYEKPGGVGMYTDLGRRLADRLASQVKLDEVIDLGRIGFAGHVFNLETSEGWYEAAGLIVSNCACTKEPVVSGVADTVRRPTGQEMFDRLSDAEQDALFAGRGGADKAELVRSGAVDLAGMVRWEPQALGHPVITEAPLEALRGR